MTRLRARDSPRQGLLPKGAHHRLILRCNAHRHDTECVVNKECVRGRPILGAMPHDSHTRWMTPDEAATHARVSAATIRYWLREKDWRSHSRPRVVADLTKTRKVKRKPESVQAGKNDTYQKSKENGKPEARS